jgi:hypothetical protein
MGIFTNFNKEEKVWSYKYHEFVFNEKYGSGILYTIGDDVIGFAKITKKGKIKVKIIFSEVIYMRNSKSKKKFKTNNKKTYIFKKIKEKQVSNYEKVYKDLKNKIFKG